MKYGRPLQPQLLSSTISFKDLKNEEPFIPSSYQRVSRGLTSPMEHDLMQHQFGGTVSAAMLEGAISPLSNSMLTSSSNANLLPYFHGIKEAQTKCVALFPMFPLQSHANFLVSLLQSVIEL
jgi:hypothetical protein